MVRYAFDPELRLALIECSGNFDHDSMVAFMKAIWEDPECNSEYSAICDFRKAQLKMSREEVMDVFYQIATDERSVKGRSALLISTPLETALGLLFQRFAQQGSPDQSNRMTVQVFYEWENACEFVNCHKDKDAFNWKTVG